ncbi:hypothetical protein [Nostoc sp.]|uniref:hypothetical protein n=1 Tax=Nostoc sp. TaxID=1180 RepID=UPI002FF889BC
MKTQFNLTLSSLAKKISDDKSGVEHLRVNRPITLNKTLMIDGIDIPSLTVNG